MHQVKNAFAITAVRGAVLGMIFGLAGCSMLESVLPADKIDYRTAAKKTASLEVPPDLTPLARDGRYAAQNGSISASDLRQDRGVNAGPANPTVALQQSGDMRIERVGNQRWLVSQRSPDQLWPLLRQFWLDRGFKLEEENAQAGLLQTEWAENRAKLPQDLIRSTLGRIADGLYSTGERDKFRTRIERSATGTEIYISHRGLEEVYSGKERDSGTVWTARPVDTALEAEMLTKLMVSLGASPEAAQAAGSSTAPERAVKARALSGQAGAALQLDDGLERAWRRVGLALDRSGFTVEDRDRTSGIYAVRYVDPTEAAKDAPNFFMKLFGAKDPAELALARYRISVKADATGTTRISVLNLQGDPDNSASAHRIVKLLVDELKY
jgi:outer membrane protein assembly factor BamC